MQFVLIPLQVQSYVTSVKYVNGYWQLTYYDSKDRNSNTVSCDYVVIANGQYVEPNVPKFPGLDTFNGNFYMCIYTLYPSHIRVGRGKLGSRLTHAVPILMTFLVSTFRRILEASCVLWRKSYYIKITSRCIPHTAG